MSDMPYFIKWIIAMLHLYQPYVCEVSANMGLWDMHDYYESEAGEPWHFFKHKCKHCGKEFYI